MLGFAARAGKCCFGNDAVERAIRRRQAALVVLDTTLSAAAQKTYTSLCAHYGVKLVHMDNPGQAAGKAGRMALAILDKGFAERIVTEFNRGGTEGKG